MKKFGVDEYTVSSKKDMILFVDPPTWDKYKDKCFNLKMFLNNYIPKMVCKQCRSEKPYIVIEQETTPRLKTIVPS